MCLTEFAAHAGGANGEEPFDVKTGQSLQRVSARHGETFDIENTTRGNRRAARERAVFHAFEGAGLFVCSPQIP